MRGDVDSLIAGHQEAGGFGAAPVFLPAPPLAPGTSLGPYEIVGLLGAGGMGEVLRARDLALGRETALKVLPRRVRPELRRRLLREAEAAARLQ